MSADITFQSRLEELCRRQSEKLTSGRHAIMAPSHLKAAVDKLRPRYGGLGERSVDVERIQKIVVKAIGEGSKALRNGERFLLSHALAEPIPLLSGLAVLDEPGLGAQLLKHWEHEVEGARLRPAVWRGLFHSYLQASSGRATERLRKLLVAGLSVVWEQVRGTPEWLGAVTRHQALLGTAPCAPYVEEMSRGDRSLLDDLLRTSAPAPASWFWEALIGTMQQELRELTGSGLKRYIPFILDMLKIDQLTIRRDSLLATTLDRYAEVSGRERDDALLLFALDTWGNPQLTSNPGWAHATDAARRMVCTWIALEDLEDFYRLCQGDQYVDEDRLKYWLRYKEQITYTQIILGSSLYFSHETDNRQFRERKRGRLALLRSAPAEHNAFLMRIGSRLFVEFSTSPNACYCYKEGALPFKLGETTYDMFRLKHKVFLDNNGGVWLTHNGRWQSRFDRELRQFGLRPDRTGAAALDHGATQRTLHERPSSASDAALRDELPRGVIDLVFETGGYIDDLRKSGGYFWVVEGKRSDELAQRLGALGFRFKEGRGYFRE